MKRKLTEESGKLSAAQKSEPILQRTLNQHISVDIAFFFFLIWPSVDWIIFATIYLPYYLLIFCVSWSLSSASMIFSKNQ